MTDSGGVQEEAPSLGKPVLIMRDNTERTEGMDAGVAVLTGTDAVSIVHHATQLIQNQDTYAQMSTAINPYGKGDTSEHVYSLMKAVLDLPTIDSKKSIHLP